PRPGPAGQAGGRPRQPPERGTPSIGHRRGARVLPGPRGREPHDRGTVPRRRGDGERSMIRVAAVGALHVGPDSAGALREQLSAVPDKADVLLIAGDLTKAGEPEGAEALAGGVVG